MATAFNGSLVMAVLSATTSSGTAGSTFIRVMLVPLERPISLWHSTNSTTRTVEVVVVQAGP